METTKKQGRGRPYLGPTVSLATRVSPQVAAMVKAERRKHHGSLRHAVEALIERGAKPAGIAREIGGGA